MSVEMLENATEGIHAPSRLGMNSFVDEKGQYHLRGKSISTAHYMNLFGSSKKKDEQNRQNNIKLVRDKFANLPTDCASIEQSIEIVKADIESLTKRMATDSGQWIKWWVEEEQSIIGELKQKQASQNCIAIMDEQKKEKERASLQDTLVKLSDSTVEKAKGDLLGIDMRPAEATIGGVNKDLVKYGAIGLGILIIGAFVMSRK